MPKTHFNQLTPAQAERLAILAEECGEVIQVVGKILRHGYESVHPDGGQTNRQLLESEIGDVQAAITLLSYNNGVSLRSDLDIKHIRNAEESKLIRISTFLHHAKVPE